MSQLKKLMESAALEVGGTLSHMTDNICAIEVQSLTPERKRFFETNFENRWTIEPVSDLAIAVIINLELKLNE